MAQIGSEETPEETDRHIDTLYGISRELYFFEKTVRYLTPKIIKIFDLIVVFQTY